MEAAASEQAADESIEILFSRTKSTRSQKVRIRSAMTSIEGRLATQKIKTMAKSKVSHEARRDNGSEASVMQIDITKVHSLIRKQCQHAFVDGTHSTLRTQASHDQQTEKHQEESIISVQTPLTSILSEAVSEAEILELSRMGPEDLEDFHKNGGGIKCNTLVVQAIETMEANTDELFLLRNGLSSLLNLCGDEERRSYIAEKGGIKVALQAMERHPSDVAIQNLGMRFLASVSVSNIENKLQVGHRNGMKVIFGNIGGEGNRSSMLFESCCAALRSICSDCEFNQVLAGSLEAVPLLVDGLTKWIDDVYALEQCLLVLTTLARKNERNATSICISGIAGKLVTIMEQHNARLNLQITCLDLSRELLRLNEPVRNEMGEAGFIEHIESGLLRYVAARKFLVLSCNCLRYLSFTSSNRRRISEFAIIPLLAASLEKWSKCVDVVASIIPAFANMTFDGVRNKNAVARNGRIATLVALFDIHDSSASICEHTCRVLRNISDGTSETKRKCVRQGAIQGVILAMKRFVNVTGVQENGCGMLANLLEGHSHMIKMGQIEEHLSKALQIHKQHKALQMSLIFLKGTLDSMADAEEKDENDSKDLWNSWFNRKGGFEHEESPNENVRGWWLSGQNSSNLIQRDSSSSHSRMILRVGDTILDAEGILNGEEIQKAVAKLSAADDTVEY